MLQKKITSKLKMFKQYIEELKDHMWKREQDECEI